MTLGCKLYAYYSAAPSSTRSLYKRRNESGLWIPKSTKCLGHALLDVCDLVVTQIILYCMYDTRKVRGDT
ncbi:hypothetical protein CY34DRAFT_568083 [Suillus luteus UH-Slu-Lm8-n1]|uniref:Uncharacterized protein n=1 Tax=Suillus luteus UH-Slu-Lm8-n1 TaxID=930992 RepID=A0A0D0BPK8_9AGAM|nr:hypothetical protein CY34DRAFT_568083 [Suillus luteus UH-Slu-Lm8-n1]